MLRIKYILMMFLCWQPCWRARSVQCLYFIIIQRASARPPRGGPTWRAKYRRGPYCRVSPSWLRHSLSVYRISFIFVAQDEIAFRGIPPGFCGCLVSVDVPRCNYPTFSVFRVLLKQATNTNRFLDFILLFVAHETWAMDWYFLLVSDSQS